MTKIIDTYNAIVGAAVALLTAVFGAYWYLFAAYLLLNILDWLSGWAKSRKLHKESSAAGLIGIVKKTGYWAIIAVAFLIASTFTHLGADLLGLDLSFLALLGWFTLACLLVNEARSICENFVEMGYNVPAVLVNGLKVTAEMVEQSKNK